MKQNKVLSFLDIGHDRIRITGLKAVIDRIPANPDCKLT
jgi:hypothetical protein